MPDIGDTLTICHGSSGTQNIEISNRENIELGEETFTYNWMVLIGGMYTVLSSGTFEIIDSVPDLSLDLSMITQNSTVRIEIYNSDQSIYLLADKEIIVNRPQVSLSSPNVLSENYFTVINANYCDNGSTPYTYSFVYADPLLSNDGDSLEGTSMWRSLDTAVFFTPFNSDTLSKENSTVKFKVLIKDDNEHIQESDVQTITVLNMGQPALPVFQYMCGNNSLLLLHLDGMDEDELIFSWYRYYADGDSVVLINDSIGRSITITDEGQYLALVSKTDTTTGTTCSRITGKVKVIGIGTVDANIIAERNELTGPEDSIMMYFTFPYDSSTLDMIHVQWYLNTLEIENANTLVCYAKEPGLYKAILLNICDEETNSNEITISQNTTSGIKSVSDKNELFIYPNPTNNIFYLVSNNPNLIEKEATVKITDVFGKTLLEWNGKLLGKNEFDLSNRSDGIYFIKVSIKSIDATEKVVKIIKTKF